MAYLHIILKINFFNWHIFRIDRTLSQHWGQLHGHAARNYHNCRTHIIL